MYYVYIKEEGVQGSLIINTSGFKGEKIELIDLSRSCMNPTPYARVEIFRDQCWKLCMVVKV